MVTRIVNDMLTGDIVDSVQLDIVDSVQLSYIRVAWRCLGLYDGGCATNSLERHTCKQGYEPTLIDANM